MAHVEVRDINAHHELFGLHGVQSNLTRVNLISLGPLRTATAAFNLLRPLTRPRNWTCPRRDTLEEFSALRTALIRIQHDLIHIVLPSNVLNDLVVGALVSMKIEGARMQKAGSSGYPNIRRVSALCKEIIRVGGTLAEISDNVLCGSTALDVFHDGIPNINGEIDILLDMFMVF